MSFTFNRPAVDNITEDDITSLPLKIIISDPQANAAARELYEEIVGDLLVKSLAELLPSGQVARPGTLALDDEDLPLLVKLITENQLGVPGVKIVTPSFVSTLARLSAYVRQCKLESLYKSIKHCWHSCEPNWDAMVWFIIMAENLPSDPYSAIGISKNQLPCLAIERTGVSTSVSILDSLPVVGPITDHVRRQICGVAYADYQTYPEDTIVISLMAYDLG